MIDADAEVPPVCVLLQSAFENYNIGEKMNQAKGFATDHPVVTVFLMVTLAMCVVPLFCFLAFAFGSAVLAFAGFIFFEGTVLMIACVVLGGILTIVGVLATGFSCFLVMAFYAYRFAQRMIQNITQAPPLQSSLVESSKKD